MNQSPAAVSPVPAALEANDAPPGDALKARMYALFDEAFATPYLLELDGASVAALKRTLCVKYEVSEYDVLPLLIQYACEKYEVSEDELMAIIRASQGTRVPQDNP